MKNCFHYFFFLIIIVTLKSNVVKSDDQTCLSNLIFILFGVNISNYCTGSTWTDMNSFSYSVSCNESNFESVNILNNGMIGSLSYGILSCFESLQNLFLFKFPIQADLFGTQLQPKVASNLHLDNCTFTDGRFSSVGNTLPNSTHYLTIRLHDNSNLKFIDLYSIKFLTNFFVTPSHQNVTIPLYSSSLQNGDSTNLSNMDIPLVNIPPLNYFRVSTLSLTFFGNSFSETDFLNLGSLNVLFLTVQSSVEMEYPNSISSITQVSSLRILNNFTAQTSGYSLPPNLDTLYISTSPKFNINGKFPFVGTLPSRLSSISITSTGLTSFLDNLPPNIQNIYFNYNTLIPQPNLPDLSSFSKLKVVQFLSNGFTGPIPNSYCSFQVALSSNNLTGSWPQCKVCFPNENSNYFLDNPLLNVGTCELGSIVPNLEYDIYTSYLTLFGENLGLTAPTIGGSIQQPFATVIIPNSRFGFTWNQTLLGPIPSILDIKISSNIYSLATGYSRPSIISIMKTGSNYTFRGINFSYNKSELIIKISGVDCVISYCEYSIINCSNINPVPLGYQVLGTIQNKVSPDIVSFYVNTIDNKTSDFIQCSTDCNEPLGYGKCNTTLGYCVCTQYYTSSNCGIANQFITSVSTVPTTGGVVNIWGWFGTSGPDLSITIGQQICSYKFTSSGFINCTLGPGSGTQSITLFQNGITYTGIDMFHYTELTYSCPKDCSNNGKCDTTTGQCKCYNGWGGYDCNSKSSPGGGSGTTSSTTSSTGSTPTPTSTPEIEIPKSNTTINGTDGSTIINNQQTTYEISILSLIETDFSNNIINTYNLSKKWDPVNITTNNIYKFTQTIQGSCIITYTIEEIKVARDYQWAGLDLTLDKDSIKISVSIKNYTFNSVLNNLQLRIESLVGDDNKNTKENNECNNKDTEVDTSEIDKNQLLNYVTISRNQKVLYGRFINRVISDSRQTFITTSIISDDNYNNNDDKQSVIIGLNLPHCTNECLIDPDFSVLVSSSYQECSSGSNKSDRASWVLPVAIVVPCVAVVLIIIFGVILYKKNRLVFLIVKSKVNGLKLKGLKK
ncbi:hypothetical protein ACTA71_001745 [Dictyostelium dimigraforme]